MSNWRWRYAYDWTLDYRCTDEANPLFGSNLEIHVTCGGSVIWVSDWDVLERWRTASAKLKPTTGGDMCALVLLSALHKAEGHGIRFVTEGECRPAAAEYAKEWPQPDWDASSPDIACISE